MPVTTSRVEVLSSSGFVTARLLSTLEALSGVWTRRIVSVGVPLVLAGYAFTFRAHGIGDHLWFMGDQQRDWMAVQGGFGELPRVGTPIATGGVSLGPVFYWVLWVIRRLLSPLLGNLPQVGAIGLVLLRSATDGLLAWALLRRGFPVLVVVGVLLVLVSSPFEGALAATIWNPGLAVTLINLTVVLLLTSAPGLPLAPWRAVALAATVWLAVQAHTPAIFVAVAVFLYLLWAADRRGQPGWIATLRAGVVIGFVVLALQLPFLWSEGISSDGDSAPGMLASGVERLVSDPGSVAFGKSVKFLIEGTERLFVSPARVPWLGLWMAIGVGLTTYLWRRAADLLAVSVLPVGLAWFGYGLVELEAEPYWLLALATPLALTVLGGLARVTPSWVATTLVGGLLVTSVIIQPGRWREFDRLFKAPQYGAIVATLRGIVAEGHAISAVRGGDNDANAVNPELLFVLLGGTLSDEGVALSVTRAGDLVPGGS